MARPPNESNLGAVCLMLLFGALLGVVVALVAISLDQPNSVKFVIAGVSIMLALMCGALGVYIDEQRPSDRP